MARLFRGQHGVATVAQLAALGLSQQATARRVARGHWVRVASGVVRLAAAKPTWESQLLAHVLAAGEGAVASHRSAAALWDLDGCRPGTPEISIVTGRRYRPADARVHQSSDLHFTRPVRRRGIPTTPVDRTVLDLGAVTPHRVVLVAIDDARRRQLTDWDQLLDCLVRHARSGRNGVGTMRAIVEEHIDEVAVTGSGFERLAYVQLVQAGLPAPVLQHEVTVGGRRYRIDMAYPHALLAIELDGSVHLRRDVWESDHDRQNALILAGWTMLRFTWRTFRDRRSEFVREVRLALQRLA